jgi:hypothetical protein
LSGHDLQLTPSSVAVPLPRQAFDTEAHEYRFTTLIAAKLAIADELATPLAKLATEDRAFIDQVLTETLIRRIVLTQIRDYFRHHNHKGVDYAG